MWQNNQHTSSVSKTFLFDIGKVLLDFDFELSLARLIPETISNPHERIQQVLERKNVLEAGKSTQPAMWTGHWGFLEVMPHQRSFIKPGSGFSQSMNLCGNVSTGLLAQTTH